MEEVVIEKKHKRKRKAPPSFYGYDPSIITLPGDPRLTPPPPSWYGVNYHASQPVSNAWLDWNGGDYELFDLSTNKVVPTSKESSIRRDEVLRKRRRFHSKFSSGNKKNNVGPPAHMVLHPTQPVHNTWMDWEENDQSSAAETSNSPSPTPVDVPGQAKGMGVKIKTETSQKSGIKPNQQAIPPALSVQVATKIQIKKEIYSTTPITATSASDSCMNIDAGTNTAQTLTTGINAANELNKNSGEPRAVASSGLSIPTKQGQGPIPITIPQPFANGVHHGMIGTTTSSILRRKSKKSQDAKGKSATAKRNAAAEVKRVKQLQLVNRVRKQLYKASLEMREAHINELKNALKVGITDHKVGLADDSSNRHSNTIRGRDAQDLNELRRIKSMIRSALGGNATYGSADHASCQHGGVDYYKIVNSTLGNVTVQKNKNPRSSKDAEFLKELEDDPQLWIDLIGEVQAQVEARRLKLLVAASPAQDGKYAHTALEGIQNIASRQTDSASSIFLLVNGVKQLDNRGSSHDVFHNGSNDAIEQGKELIEHLGLTDDQIMQIRSLGEKCGDESEMELTTIQKDASENLGSVENLLLELKILERVAGCLWSTTLGPRFLGTKTLGSDALNPKQVEKILLKVAAWELSNQEIGHIHGVGVDDNFMQKVAGLALEKEILH